MKVRIPAVISPSGKWAAYGWGQHESPLSIDNPDWAMVEEVADNGEMESTYYRIWITVDLPIPKTIELTGEVEK
jgi:hypothetical protein